MTKATNIVGEMVLCMLQVVKISSLKRTGFICIPLRHGIHAQWKECLAALEDVEEQVNRCLQPRVWRCSHAESMWT